MKAKQFFLSILYIFCSMATNAQITGNWKGTLNVQGNNIDLIFHITENNGVYKATIDVPAQGASGISIDTVKFENEQLKLASLQMHISYIGKLAGNNIDGAFQKDGMSLPLSLSKFESKLHGIRRCHRREKRLIN